MDKFTIKKKLIISLNFLGMAETIKGDEQFVLDYI